MTPDETLRLLEQRRPTRFIDEILELDSEHILTKYTWREEDCAGHFPGNPVVPGVKMLEMAAQSGVMTWGAYLTGGALPEAALTEADKVLFKKMLRPGQTTACRASFGREGGLAEGRLAAEVELKFLGGPQDGETIFTGRLAGAWPPRKPENSK